MRITHPVKGYTGPVSASGRRIWFMRGEAEAFNLEPRARRSLEEGGFEVVNPRAQGNEDEDDAEASDEE